MLQLQHYCREHQTRFYRNEKVGPDGEMKVWYSHKKADGSGFCVEKDEQYLMQIRKPLEVEEAKTAPANNIFACNAMNNAIALACNGKIEVNQIGAYYRKILTQLQEKN